MDINRNRKREGEMEEERDREVGSGREKYRQLERAFDQKRIGGNFLVTEMSYLVLNGGYTTDYIC